MKESDIKKALQQVNKYRKKGETDLAIEKLSILNQEYPQNTEYLVLIAKTFIEARQINKAIEYCNKALSIDSLCPEAYVELGYIEERQHNVSKAEEYYKKSLDKDNYFLKGHIGLMKLYYKQEKYEEAIAEAEFLLQNFDTERNNYSIEEKQNIGLNWLSATYYVLRFSWINLKNYKKALRYSNEMKEFMIASIPEHDNFQYYKFVDEAIYQLYYILNDAEKINEYENNLMTIHKIQKNRILQLQEEANKGNFKVK